MFLKIDRDGNLYIRKPNKVERVFQIFLNLASIIVFASLSLLLAIYVYAPISIRIQLALFLLIISLTAMLLFFLLQASSIPIAKKIREEVETNPFIIKHNTRTKNLRKKKIVDIEEYKKLRPYGLCEGEFTVPDDFDEPLPEDILNSFEGK